MIISCDPGSVNAGVAYFTDEGEFLYSKHINPSEIGFSNTVNDILSHEEVSLSLFVIERYVAYEGTHNKASEAILMLIGALVYRAEQLGATVQQYRALDWKMELCKYLVRNKKFSNPSRQHKLDKEFSIAAAECIIGHKPKTDHEADAICLAYYGRLQYESQTRQKGSD